jgi:hypothetical protein
MKDEAELYWRMYLENCTQGRHHETQRAAVTTILVSVAAAGLAFMRPTNLPISSTYIPLAVLLIGIGVFGAIFARKEYERFALHMRRAAAYRNEIDKLYPGLNLRGLKRGADHDHATHFPRLGDLSLNWLWVALHGLVALMGAVVLLLAVCQVT